MNTCTTILVLSAITFVSSMEFMFSGDALDLLTEARKKCFVSEEVDASYLNKLDQAEIPSRDEIHCHTYCVLKSINFINDKSEVFPEIVMKYIKDPVVLKFVSDAINTCIQETKGSENACDRAYQIHSCFNSLTYKKK